MKNLFKLTRLWVASLLLLFGFTTNAWADNKLKGSWDNYTEHTFSNDETTINISSAGDYWFGIQYGSEWKDCNQCGAITRENSQGDHKLYSNGGGHQKIYCDKSGPYVFKITHDDGPHVKVTYPDGGFHDIYVACTVNGSSSSWQKSNGNKGFGNVTSLVVNDVYLKFWDNFGKNKTAWSNKGSLGYKYDSHDYHIDTDEEDWKGYDSSQPNNYQFKKTGADVDLVKLVSGNSDTKKNSGKYEIEVWGKVNSTTNGWGDAYLKNGDNNFKWTFTILPPAVSNFAVSASGYKSGSGTENDPYLVQYGSTLTLSASGSKEHDDANSSLEVKFGDNSYSATTTHDITVNSTTKKSIEVKGKYRNSTASLDGEESTKTIYYQAVYTGLTAVASPAAAVSSNPTISAEYTSSSVNVSEGTAKEGYKFKNWSSTNGNFNTTTTPVTFTPTANDAVATANYQIKVTFDNQSHDTAPADQWIDYNGKVSKPTDLSEAGWEFGGWYKENTCTNQWDFSSDVVTAPITLYAKWTQSSVYYKITKGVNDVAMGSISSNAGNESQVLSGSTITFTARPNEGYEVVAWYTDAACTEGEHDAGQTTYSQVINSDTTVYVKFQETKHAVTIDKGTGISSVTPSGSQQVGNVTPIGISAEVATGYTWNQWTKTGDVTIDNASSINTSIKATGTGTVTATATENTVTLTPTVNDDNMGTVSGGGSVGIATSQTITANKKSGYKFDHWDLSSNLIIQNSKTINDSQITVKTNGDGEAVSAQAVFVEDLSTGVYLQSNGITPQSWTDLEAYEFKKISGQSTSNDAYLTITTTEDEQYNYVNGTKDNNQFILHDSRGAEGKRILSLEDGYWFVNSYALNTTLNQFGSSGYKNMRFFSTVVGTYTLHYNLSTRAFDIAYPNQYSIQICDGSGQWTAHNFVDNAVSISLSASSSIRFRVVYQGAYYGNSGTMTNDNCTGWTMENNSTTRKECWINTVKAGSYTFSFNTENKQLSVTYPEEMFQTVTVYEDGITPKEVKVYEVSKPSITAQVPEGMNFNGWVCTGGATVANASATNTTVTNAGTNGTVKATFNTNQYIYFKDGVNGKFGNVWVTFRKSDYWDDSKGSGNNELSYAALGMTKIKNTDIHYFRIADDKMSWDEVKNGIVQFTNSGNIQQNFYMTKVAYPHHNNSSSCYRGCLPLFVPRDWIYDINSSQYYNDGIWMKYNSTESGFRIKGSWDSWTSNDYKFVAATPGGYEFRTTLTLAAGTTYDFKIYDEDGRTYSIAGVMTATSCTNWHMYMNQNNCQITTSEAGDYTFVLNLGSGEVIVSVEYPLSNDDYHVVAKQGSEVKWEGDLIKNSKNVAKKDTTSFFNNNYTYQLQRYAGENKWNNIGGEVTITDDKAQVGVINLIVEQDGQGNATLTYEGVYKGNFYIRTDGVDGGWGSYKTNPDNKMDNYGSLLVADPTYQYDVYKAKWVLSGKNVKFRIANDYSKAISDELKEDTIIDNKETLPQGANVRFMWNSKTNQLKRAYISGSTDTKDRYLVLTGDEKMFDEKGNVIPAGTVENQREGLLANELPFKDMNNWVYQADIKAQPQCAVKLTAKYNNQIQYFIGAAGEEAGSRKTIIAGNGETQYTMRVVYDFKTNLLIAGWVPDGKEITDTIKLGGDMLISRTHQDSAQQIIFGATGSIEDIHHIYGVLSIKKDTMLGKGDAEKGAKYTTVATNADYERTMYWISFPFKVKISEIFGVDGYGTKWIMQKYRGDLRAQKGWFKQDTPTFWEYMDVTDSLNAYEGYLFLIDANYFNTEDADAWKNSATEANFYFPSASGNIGIINKSEYTQEVPAHKCEIKREFNIGTEQYPIMVSHEQTDSYWNVIGVPAFQNKSLVLGEETETDMKAIYEWNSLNNTYTPKALKDQFRFQTMHAYMVQFGGDITWSDVSVVNNTKAPYRYAYADTKNYFIKLFFGNTEAEDHAYINLADEASTDFVLNEDMMKLDNAGFPNIYSFAGNYNVAYNETKMENQVVTIGVSAPKDGSYTFSMPKDFSGSAILVDLESGEATDLNLSNYTVELNKGTYNNRFQLLLEVEAKAPTAIDNAKGEWSVDGKTKKLLINDNIYLINGGRVYNVLGVEE